MSAVLPQVLQVSADVFYISPSELSPTSSPDTVEGWDSLQHLNLVLALEEVFALDFTPEEISEMKSIGTIASVVERKLQGQRSSALSA